jgi:hypothetical protein
MLGKPSATRMEPRACERVPRACFYWLQRVVRSFGTTWGAFIGPSTKGYLIHNNPRGPCSWTGAKILATSIHIVCTYVIVCVQVLVSENAKRVNCKQPQGGRQSPLSVGTDVHEVRPALCSPCGNLTIKNVQRFERSRDLTSCGVHDMKTVKTIFLHALTIVTIRSLHGCVWVVLGETQNKVVLWRF